MNWNNVKRGVCLKAILMFQTGLYATLFSAAQFVPDHEPYSANAKINFVRSWSVLKPLSNPQDVINSNNTREVQMATEYLDGLGRPIQTVIKKGSLNTTLGQGFHVDLVKARQYDAFGRERFGLLPIAATERGGSGNISDGEFKTNAVIQGSWFYGWENSPYYQPLNSYDYNYTYSKTKFEPSPLNRPIENYAPGQSWVGTQTKPIERSVKMGYYVNTILDSVRIWKLSNSGTLGNFGSYSSIATYGIGQLYKTATTDEHGKQIIEFKDKDGLVILKKVQLTGAQDNGLGSPHEGWLCTYYVYDKIKNLRAVIQPVGVEKLSTINWSLTGTDGTNLYNEQCFRYEYDMRRRMIRKKVPGAAVVYMVYDARDRLVLIQDGNMRANGNWMYTWYDKLNRPTTTGLWTTGTTGANSLWTTHYDAVYNTTTAYPEATATGLQELTTTFYDSYGWLTSSAHSGHGLSPRFILAHNIYLVASNDNITWPYVRKVVATAQLKGMVTGGRIFILNSNPGKWLYTSNYYDEEGRLIQVQSRNITDGTDFVTSQYSFSGLPLTTVTTQQVGGSATQTTVNISSLTYDHLGRLEKTEKRIANTLVNDNALSAAKIVNQIKYSALGQLKIKTLGQKRDENGNFTSNPLETLTYEYNIRGWLRGVNQTYLTELNPLPGSTNWFGYDLQYDKLGSIPQFNGNISKMGWRSMGDNVNRVYDYGYDPANRLLKALFRQKNSDGSSNNSEVNYNVIMGNDGTDILSAYDANGNIQKMTQYGLKIGASPLTAIDQLTYNYDKGGLSNKLINVIDQNVLPTTLGDFRTSSLSPNQTKTTTTLDYIYDPNGNLIKDFNRDLGKTGANGIAYNHLNLPQTITVYKSQGATKGTITYIYDAAGNKRQKKVEELNATVNALTTNITTTNTYMGGAVYESRSYSNTNTYFTGLTYSNRLQFVAQEEGRIRFKPLLKAIPASFEYDYFLKDHLGNVRMVLTEEKETLFYPAATLEGIYSATGTAQANSMINHEKQFYNIDNTKVILERSLSSWTTPPETIPNTKLYYNNNGNPPANLSYPLDCSPTQTSGSASLYAVNATTNPTGLEFMIKVMAGDKVDILGKSYYKNTTNITNSNSTPLDALLLLTNLLLSPANAASGKGLTPSDLNTLNSGLIPSSFFRGANNESSTTVPKAYINYIFLDEQFKYAGGDFSRVGSSITVKDHWKDDAQLQNIPVPKNGYIFVYVSNESNLTVYFDNLQVIHKPGPILEETHYYPFGLTMAGISSKASGKLENKRKWNGASELANKEFNDGSGLELYETFYRSLDPQIGRFWQIDPEVEAQESYSPYESMGNNPISNVDPLGNFKTRFGAWWHSLWNGGGDVGENKYGEYYVRKTESSYSEEGGVTVTAKMTYGKGRNAYSAAAEALSQDYEALADIQKNGENSMYQMYNSQEEQRKATLSYTGLLFPNVTIRPLTIASNFKKVSTVVEAVKKSFSLTKHGELTNGIYTVSKLAMQKHIFGGYQGKSVFYPTLNAEEAVLKAAEYADEMGLWIGNKAKVPVTNTNIGTLGSGQPSNIINVYRKPNGFIHGSPGN